MVIMTSISKNIPKTETSLHIIVLTVNCNMNCLYCQVMSKKSMNKENNMTTETAKEVIDFIFQSPNKEITIELQGGEPTLNWKVLKFIIDYANALNVFYGKNLEFSIVTNMTTMNDKRMNFLIENNVNICTSLDGDEKLHNKNRIYTKNNYKEVTYWIKKFQKEYKKRNIDKEVSALPTLTKDSLKNIKGIINEYVKNKIDVIHLRQLTKLGMTKINWNKIGYPDKDFITAWDEGVNYIHKLKGNGIKIDERMELIIRDKIEKKEDTKYYDLMNPCGALIGQIAYDINGDIYSCDEARMLKIGLFKFGNVRDTSYINCIFSDKCHNLVEMSKLENFKKCKDCNYISYCGTCPVLNYSRNGDEGVSNIDEDRCNLQHFQFEKINNLIAGET